jgi:hypothetical protein
MVTWGVFGWLVYERRSAAAQHDKQVKSFEKTLADELRIKAENREQIGQYMRELQRLENENIRLENELTEQSAAPTPTLRHVHIVRFEYLPASSPLDHGWKDASPEPSGAAEFYSDPDIIGSLRMKVTKGIVAIHHDLPPHARRANRIEFRARYSTTTRIFTHLIVATMDDSAQRNVFVSYFPGERGASPTWPNPNPGRKPEVWLPEQTLHWPADLFGDGCLSFELPLNEVVRVLLGSQGWVFKSIEGIRLRGDLSISPIDLQLSS